MKNLILVLAAVLAIFGCSRDDHSDPSGSGTRGGGDVCEIDFNAQLGKALIWLKSRPKDLMDFKPGDYEKIQAIPTFLTDHVKVFCVTEPIVDAGIRKTAYTTQLGPQEWRTNIDPNMWFAAESNVRGGLTIHEVLVMYGIEKTGDYHLSDTYDGTDLTPIVGSLVCKKTIWQDNQFTLNLDARNLDDLSLLAYTMVVTLKVGGNKLGPEHINRLFVADDLSCEFSERDQNLFSCYQRHQTGAVELVAEMVDSGMGRELRIFWDAIENPVMKAEEARAKTAEYLIYQLVKPIRGAVVIPLGNSTLGLPLDDPRATRCKTHMAL